MNFNRLYIHVPFCSSKCGYCAFYSEVNASEEMIQAYLNHLEEEFFANSVKCNSLDSVFIGGGTPNFLSSANLAKLFELISANFAIADDAEVSIECNPESLDKEKVSIIANFANRVSLGIQSFNCEFRNTLGRAGGASALLKGIELIQDSGVSNFGCDLIYSIPGQTLSDWENELKKAVELGVKHISAYSLTYEEGTRLTESLSSAPRTTDLGPLITDLGADMWELTDAILKGAGIPRYEVSNYAVPSFECRHNLEVWYGETYLGCGPAATSFDGKDRYTNPSNLKEWLNGAESERDVIPAEKRAAEILIMGLRTSQGWNIPKFEKRTGFSIDNWNKQFSDAECDGLLKLSNDTIAPTEKGLIFWDEIAERLI